jgi:hypothetical protein
MCPGNVYPVHEHDKQRRKPTRTPRPRPRPRPRQKNKLPKFVNEVMPFLKSRSSSSRFRMESTKGKVNMHFERRRRNQDFIMPKQDYATPAMTPSACLRPQTPLNNRYLTTQLRQRQRNQDSRIPKIDYKTPTTPPQHLLTKDTANNTTAKTCKTQNL